MRYVAAYMLAAMGSKGDPTVADVEKILGSVGVEVEAEKVKKVVNELQGKNLEELIEEGSKKLASVPSGGAVVAAAAGAAPAAAAEAPVAAKEEKKEESEESDDDMGFGLFD